MMNEKDLKTLAEQLSHPKGEAGRQIAEMMHESNIQMTRASFAAMNLLSGNHILEIGHGNAAHVAELLSSTENLRYTGLEISETMHEEALRINSNDVNNSSVRFMLYNGEKLPFPEHSFDQVFTVNTFYFWPDPLSFLQEIHRVLKNRGTFVLTFLEEKTLRKIPFTQFGFHIRSQQETEHLLSEAGFKKVLKRTKKDVVTSKTGEQIEREFVVLSITK